MVVLGNLPSLARVPHMVAPLQIKLADKQAAVEKLQWEATTSNQRVEKLQKDLEMMQGEMSLFMSSFYELTRETSTADDYDIVTYQPDQHFDIVSQSSPNCHSTLTDFNYELLSSDNGCRLILSNKLMDFRKMLLVFLTLSITSFLCFPVFLFSV